MIELIPLYYEGGDPSGYVAHGVHDAQEFLDQIQSEYQDEFFTIEDVYYCYARIIPVQDSTTLDLRYLFHRKKGKGAFKITFVEGY